MSNKPSQIDRRSVADAELEVLYCLRCGYDLRSLLPPGNCPECGLGIVFSRANDKLARLDQLWLRRVQLGARWISIAAIISLVAIILLPVATLIVGPSLAAYLLAIPILGLWFGVGGLWHCTALPEIAFLPDYATVARKLARYVVPLGVLFLLSVFFFMQSWLNTPRWLPMVLGLMGGVAASIGIVATGLYSFELSKLFGNEKVQRLARQYLSAFIVSVAIVLLSATLSFAGLGWAQVALGLALFGMLISGGLTMAIPMHFRDTIENAIRRIPRDPWLANRLIAAEKESLIRDD